MQKTIKYLPRFEKRFQYTELKAISTWRFKLLEDVTIPISGLSKKKIRLVDGNGVTWAKVTPTSITILKNYAWNGCSPKAAFCRRFWGTPDFENTRLASMVHDVLYQFAGVDDLDCDFWDANGVFFSIINMSGSPVWARIYKLGVDVGGAAFYPIEPKNGVKSMFF